VKVQHEPWRLERKFLVSKAASTAWEAALKTHPLGYRRLYPSRLINSLYLETMDLHDATAHLNGNERRSKMRIRWYGERFGRADRPVLEVKQKRGRYGRKLRFALPPLQVTPQLTRLDLSKILKAARLPVDVRESCARRPQMFFNRYQRAYFSDVENRFRITLDNRLQYARASSGQRLSHRLDSMPGYMVVELKYAVQDEALQNFAVQSIPLRLTRHSKYLNGLLDRLTL
jgi:hypothetical protein